jgi:hypothetical protein
VAIKGSGRTALGDLCRHCSEQNGNVAIVYDDLRDQSAGASRRLVPKKRLKQSGIELYDDCFELGLRDGEVCLVKAAREDADASGSSPEFRTLKLSCPLVMRLTCARCHPQLISPLPPALCFSSKKPNQGVAALVSKGVSIAGTIFPSTIPVICSPGFARLAMQAEPPRPQPLSQ